MKIAGFFFGGRVATLSTIFRARATTELAVTHEMGVSFFDMRNSRTPENLEHQKPESGLQNRGLESKLEFPDSSAQLPVPGESMPDKMFEISQLSYATHRAVSLRAAADLW